MTHTVTNLNFITTNDEIGRELAALGVSSDVVRWFVWTLEEKDRQNKILAAKLRELEDEFEALERLFKRVGTG
jgi:hypothetical protein